MGDPNGKIDFWLKLAVSFSIATVISCIVAIVNMMICSVLLEIYRNVFNFMGDAYWIMSYSFVVWVVSWIVSFGYLMSEG